MRSVQVTLSIWEMWQTYAIIFGVILVLIAICMAILPIYGVWSSRKSGEAQLAEANYAQQVAIAHAKARLEAAELNKQAEIIDAQAVAKSVETIGHALHNNEGYLRWQWIKMMTQTDSDVIYVPTEAGLPILEAGRKVMQDVEL